MRILPVVLLLLAACGGDDATAVDASADAVAADALPGTWYAGPAVGGGPIQETAAVAIGSLIYVIGGFDGGLAIRNNVRIYSIGTNEWLDAPDLPEPVHHANAAVVDGTIYIVGFLSTFNFTARGEVWAWNPGNDPIWTTRASMPVGSARGASIVGVIDDVIYVAGGLRGGEAVVDVSAYHPISNTWDDTLPDLPAPRDHGCGGVIGTELIVAGGRQADIGSTTDQVLALTPATPGGTWQTRAPMITGRGGTACGVVFGRLIVVGGEGNPDAASGVFPQAESYNPVTDTWTSLDPMPTPRHGMGAAAVGDSLYVPGGAITQAFGADDTFEILRP